SPVAFGRPNRNAVLPGGTPFLQPTWQKAMAAFRTDRRSIDKGVTAEIEKIVKASLDSLAMSNKAPYSAFVPVTATLTTADKKVPMLVYRDYNAVTAVNLRDG